MSVVTRGLETLTDYSEKYTDTELHHYLLSKPDIVRVHHDCRRLYTSKRRYEQQQAANNLRDTEPSSSKMLRSSSQAFNWKTHCFFCGETCNLDKNACHVETLEIRDSTLYQARADAWAIEVQGRLTNCCDLVAEEALYHKNCHRNFYCSYVYSVPGRPTDNVKHEVFERVCLWLEMNDSDLLRTYLNYRYR